MPRIDFNKRYVRVTGATPNGFVEFEFSIGDPSLCVALVLPEAAFREFCGANAVILIGKPETELSIRRQAPAGLLRSVK